MAYTGGGGGGKGVAIRVFKANFWQLFDDILMQTLTSTKLFFLPQPIPVYMPVREEKRVTNNKLAKELYNHVSGGVALSMKTMSPILDGNSFHLAHASRKIVLSGKKTLILYCFRSNRMP